MPKEPLRDRLAKWRGERDLSYREAAKQVGVSVNCYRKIEQGETLAPDVDTVKKCAKKLGCSWRTLLA